jgi:hypothetical protein
MTLREKCEKAAATAYVRHSDCPEALYGSTCGICVARRKKIADAIERVAKAFAADAMEEIVSTITENGQPRSGEMMSKWYAEAIAAAERGE